MPTSSAKWRLGRVCPTQMGMPNVPIGWPKNLSVTVRRSLYKKVGRVRLTAPSLT